MTSKMEYTNEQRLRMLQEALGIDPKATRAYQAAPAPLHVASSYKKLDFSGKQLTKIPDLSKYHNLQVLKLSVNSISKIENFDLPKLIELQLSINKITKIENLDALTKLKNLHLAGNKISTLEGLDKLENLEWLDIQLNSISKLDALESLPKLSMLHINCNKIDPSDPCIERLRKKVWDVYI